MGFFWQISYLMGTFTIRKTKAARTRIWGCKGHYMGLKMSVFFEMGGYKGLDFRDLPKRVNVGRPEGVFSGNFRNLRELFLKRSVLSLNFFWNLHQPYRTFL
jgi:hypothetical protein